MKTQKHNVRDIYWKDLNDHEPGTFIILIQMGQSRWLINK